MKSMWKLCLLTQMIFIFTDRLIEKKMLKCLGGKPNDSVSWKKMINNQTKSKIFRHSYKKEVVLCVHVNRKYLKCRILFPFHMRFYYALLDMSLFFPVSLWSLYKILIYSAWPLNISSEIIPFLSPTWFKPTIPQKPFNIWSSCCKWVNSSQMLVKSSQAIPTIAILPLSDRTNKELGLSGWGTWVLMLF